MNKKIVIYQTFPRIFGNKNPKTVTNGSYEQNGSGKMDDFDTAILNRIHGMGVTHVWYTGVVRHATATDYAKYGIPRQNPRLVKGKAGSPYAITDYYDVDPDLATNVESRMEEWEALIRRTHEAGMKVIMDFVPNHVARQYHSVAKPSQTRDLGENDNTGYHFSTSNNFYYCWGQPLDLSRIPLPDDVQLEEYEEIPAKATGNDRFDPHPEANDWYETVKLNYGIDYCDLGGRSEHFCPIPDTWGKMTDILLFWAAKGVDGFRCDMAEMVPSAFWCWATDKVKFAFPDIIFIGEVYNPNQYREYVGAGFDFLYDKVGMYDCLCDVIKGYRDTADITRQWQANDDIAQHMLYFMENHDEVRLASDFLAVDGRKGLPALVVSTLLSTNPMMIYAGQEFGERGMDQEGFSGVDGRTTIFDYWTVDSIRRGYFDRRHLRKAERELYSVYSAILRMANEEKAFRDGKTFDLMYVNGQMAKKQFAFLRKYDNEVILVAVNFDETETVVRINLPRHAFDYLQMPETNTLAVDLITGSKRVVTLCDHEPISLDILPHGTVILKMIV